VAKYPIGLRATVRKRSSGRERGAAGFRGYIKLFYLQRSLPRLNPDDWTWQNMKKARIGRARVTSFHDLKDKVLAAIPRLATNPSIVRVFSNIARGFFLVPELAYIGCHEP